MFINEMPVEKKKKTLEQYLFHIFNRTRRLLVKLMEILVLMTTHTQSPKNQYQSQTMNAHHFHSAKLSVSKSISGLVRD